MIREILPAAVSSEEAFADLAGTVLFPEEQELVAGAVDKRRREFTTGRRCARSALNRLGIPPAPLLSGDRGAPRWPPGIVGSITHCAGYRAAAVACEDDLAAIGLDAEPHGALPGGVLELVSLAPERAQLTRLVAADPGICWDRLLFSAKESVYKAWFPLRRCWLDFGDVDLTIDTAGRTFEARLLVPVRSVGGSPLTGFSGRWLIRNRLILTAVTVPAGGSLD